MKYPGWKGSCKAIFINRCHKSLYRKSNEIYKNSNRTGEFSKLAECKINMQ